jgi:hypothetical protein
MVYLLVLSLAILILALSQSPLIFLLFWTFGVICLHKLSNAFWLSWLGTNSAEVALRPPSPSQAMNWLQSLFSASSSQSTRRGQATSLTHDAFSLPTSSPGFGSHPEPFGSDYPEPESATSATSYTYPPPQGSSQYGYVPTSYV